MSRVVLEQHFPYQTQVETMVGIPENSGYVDGTLEEAMFNHPTDIAFHSPSNTLYVADSWNHCIRVIHDNSKSPI